MAENSHIAWCDHTWNPWMGCMKVSPGCQNCYAETLTKNRMGLNVWGPAKTTARKVTSDAYWRKPKQWDKRARDEGTRYRVFCGSLCDVFEDHPGVEQARERLFELIFLTPNLDWLLLTKRPENIWPMAGGTPLDICLTDNVWLGTSVEDQQRADERIPRLKAVPAAVHFLSCEPLLGPVVLSPFHQYVDWVIVGGESGPGFRPMNLDWARSLRDECAHHGVPFFFKQSSAYRPGQGDTLDGERIQEFPTVVGAP